MYSSLLDIALSRTTDDDDDDVSACKHDQIDVVNFNRICVACSRVVSTHYVFDKQSIVDYAQPVRRPSSSRTMRELVAKIPTYVTLKTHNDSVRLFKLVMAETRYRRKLKSAIMLSCLHRAAMKNAEGFFIDDLTVAFDVDRRDVDQASRIVSTSLVNHHPERTEFAIDYCEDECYVYSILTTIGFIYKQQTYKVFKYIVNRSNIITRSYYKFAVYACAYFVCFINRSSSMKLFTASCPSIGTTTLTKKYLRIATFILGNLIVKPLYAYLLGDGSFSEPVDQFDVDVSGRDVSVCRSSRVIDLDRVSDLDQWNRIMLNKTYYYRQSPTETKSIALTLKPTKSSLSNHDDDVLLPFVRDYITNYL